MNLIKWLFRGEVIFAGYLTGYVLTSVSPYMPNATYLFFFLSVLIALKRLWQNPEILKMSIAPIILFSMFLFFITGSYFYSESDSYGLKKILEFYTLTTWSFLGVYLLIKNKKSLNLFFKGVIFFSVIIAFLLIVTSVGSTDLRSGIGGESNVISTARISGLGIICIIGLFIYNTTNKIDKIKSVFLITILFSAVLLTASRGPLISVLAAITFFIIFSFGFSLKKKEIYFNSGIFYFIFIAILSLPVFNYFFNRGFFDSFIYRFEVLFSSGGGTSVIQRTNRFNIAEDMFMNSPIIGGGVGSFSMVYNGIDEKEYPHNIILEILSEFGMIGFLLFSTFMLYSFFIAARHFMKSRFNTHQITIIVMFVYLFLNANISGDINTNRMLFTTIALISLIPLYKEKYNNIGNYKTSQ